MSTNFKQSISGTSVLALEQNDQTLATWSLRLSIYPRNEQAVKQVSRILNNEGL